MRAKVVEGDRQRVPRPERRRAAGSGSPPSRVATASRSATARSTARAARSCSTRRSRGRSSSLESSSRRSASRSSCEPTILVGTATISVVRVTDINGGLLVAFPTPSAPYRVEAQDVKGSLGKLVGRTFTARRSRSVATSASRVSSSLAIPFGNAYLAYSAPDYIALGGGAQFIFPGGTIKASIDGEMRVSQALFSLHGSAEFCFRRARLSHRRRRGVGHEHRLRRVRHDRR